LFRVQGVGFMIQEVWCWGSGWRIHDRVAGYGIEFRLYG
jgi:hypothetical protein